MQKSKDFYHKSTKDQYVLFLDEHIAELNTLRLPFEEGIFYLKDSWDD